MDLSDGYDVGQLVQRRFRRQGSFATLGGAWSTQFKDIAARDFGSIAIEKQILPAFFSSAGERHTPDNSYCGDRKFLQLAAVLAHGLTLHVECTNR